MRVRRSLVALAIAAAFGSGFLCSRLLERSAHAQVSPLSSTVYIPSDGLVFRTFDGHVAARLSYGSQGGVFELFDEHEAPAAVVRAGSAVPAVAGRAVTGPAKLPKTPYESDLGF